MDFPFTNNAPAGEADSGAQSDFWDFNPQQPPPISNSQADDTSLDELLALYQTAQDAPAPFAPMDAPEAYPAFPAFDAGGDPATDAPFPAFGDAGGFDFGADAGGPVFPAFGEEAAPAADAFGAFETPAADAGGFDFGGDTGGFGAFDAPAADAGGFGAFDAPAADAGGFPAFDAPAAEAGSFDFGGDTAAFPPLGEAAPAQDAGAMDFSFEGGPSFPAFGEEAAPAAEAFGAFEAPAAEAGSFDFGGDVTFPPLGEAAPADDAGAMDFSFDGGPVFEAVAPEAPATPEAPSMDFDFGDDSVAFPPLEMPTPVAEAEDELEEFVDDFDLGGTVFDAMPVEPPAPVEPVPAAVTPEPAPVVRPAAAQPDPEQTLRLKEVPAFVPSAPAPAAVAGLEGVSLAELTGREVVIRTAEERQAANQQLSQVVGALASGLDELQGRMAGLYGELQRAAVRRAPVDEIQTIASELAQAKVAVGEGSELHKQALYLRQVADAYLSLLREI